MWAGDLGMDADEVDDLALGVTEGANEVIGPEGPVREGTEWRKRETERVAVGLGEDDSSYVHKRLRRTSRPSGS